ncbi:hypothetical protein ANCCAN_16942 [Ancylostoma caninum]|uniref:Uncharacterized protein n=1 Tax=Ancylostoma caninum TaxID=29170 RepID=A0A368FYA2_ANCCA|nr:hypothetical protein ANCCAN_16942 [Ancylostoma caninum]
MSEKTLLLYGNENSCCSTTALLQVSDAISKPSVWMQTINSGIHLFVYLTLNRDFRKRAFHLLRGGGGEMEISLKYPESHINDGADVSFIRNGNKKSVGHLCPDQG